MRIDNPFHEGEMRVQERAGELDPFIPPFRQETRTPSIEPACGSPFSKYCKAATCRRRAVLNENAGRIDE